MTPAHRLRSWSGHSGERGPPSCCHHHVFYEDILMTLERIRLAANRELIESHVLHFHEDIFEGQCVTGTDWRLGPAEAGGVTQTRLMHLLSE